MAQEKGQAVKWIHLAASADPPYCDLNLAGRIAEIMPKAIPEKGPGMWTDHLTDDEIKRIREALEKVGRLNGCRT